MSKIIFSKFSTERLEKYQIRTDILKKKDGTYCVRKVPVSVAAYGHIAHMKDTYEILKGLFQDSFIRYNVCSMKQQDIYFEYLEGDNLNDLLIQNMKTGNRQEVCRLMDLFFEELKRVYPVESFTPSKEFEEIFGEISCEQLLQGAKYLNIDMIFSNVIIQNGTWHVFDYEWVFDFFIPLGYVIYRVIHQLAIDCEEFDYAFEDELMTRYGILEADRVIYSQMETAFQAYVRGKQQGINNLANIWNTKCNMSIQKLLNVLTYQVYFDYGDGYLEQNSYRVEYENTLDAFVHVIIQIPEHAVAVRFDPCDGACIMHFKKFYGLTEKGKQVALTYQANGRRIQRDGFLFKEIDPMICMDIDDKKIRFIELCFTIMSGRNSLINGFDREVSKLQDTVEELQTNNGMKSVMKHIANRTINKGKQ